MTLALAAGSTGGDDRRARCSFAFIGSNSRKKIGWMAELLGFQWYDDFKENLGPRWPIICSHYSTAKTGMRWSLASG